MTRLFLRRSGWVALLFLWVASVGLPAFQKTDHHPLPDFDQRQEGPRPGRMANAGREVAVEKLVNQVPGLRVARDHGRGGIRHVASTEGFLTGPNGEGKAVPVPAARALPGPDPHRPIKAFLDEHPKLFGYGSEMLRGARLRTDSLGRRNALRTVVWEQRLDDIAVYEGVLIGHITGKGELVSVSSQFVAEPARAADAGTPQRARLEAAPSVSAAGALLRAADHVGETILPGEIQPQPGPLAGPERAQAFKAGPLPGTAQTRLVWLPLHESALRLCWEVELTRRAGGERYRVLVDAQSGEMLLRQCLTLYAEPASFRVFAGDSPTPFAPGWGLPNSNQPPTVPRQLLTFTAWHQCLPPRLDSRRGK